MRWTISALAVFGIAITSAIFVSTTASDADETSTAVEHNPKAVDVSMHDFMEGVFQSPYRRLKQSMAAAPADNAAWKALRSDALILAEGGNLLLLRKPEKDIEAWDKYSVDSRDAGAELVKAAKQKDFAAAKTAYEKMLVHCNGCHTQFDKGKNQLQP
jgi:mono/diheme cytochrome c family protein